jgi:hypothetical protein
MAPWTWGGGGFRANGNPDKQAMALRLILPWTTASRMPIHAYESIYHGLH